MDPRRWPLGTRLWATYTTLVTLVVLGLATYVWTGARSTLESDALDRVAARAGVVHDLLVPVIAAGDLDADAAADAASAALGSDPAAFVAATVRIVGRDGTVLAERGFPGGPGPSADESDALRTLAAGLPRWSGFVPAPGGGTLAVAYRALPDGTGGASGTAHVRVSSSAADIAGTLGELTLVLASGVALASLLGALLGALVVRYGLRPLRDMAGVSRRVAEGELDARVAVPASDDEIGALARDFNAMADRLEAVFAQQRAFVADASHELRTPLTAVGGQLDVLAVASPDDAEALRRSMRRQIDRMTRLTEDLLTLTRFDAPDARPLEARSTDLAAIVRDVVEEARALPAAADRRITVSGDTDAPLVADPSLLHRAILNLVVNALQHAPAAAVVDVHVAREPSAIDVRITDEGPGFADGDLERVFDRFYRADPARSEMGTGLGLSIARAIVTAHGGTVRAGNTGHGAIVTISLPLVRPNDP